MMMVWIIVLGFPAVFLSAAAIYFAIGARNVKRDPPTIV